MNLSIKDIQDLKFKLQYFYRILNFQNKLCLEMYIKYIFINETDISFNNYLKILTNIEFKIKRKYNILN
jgi:hypothetical protein